MTLDDLRRELQDVLPLLVPPLCQHRYEGQKCGRAAEHECETVGGVRPRYVCGTCLQYQVAAIGRLVHPNEMKPVRINGEGKIVPIRKRR